MNILVPSESHCKMVRLPHPVLNNTQLDILCNIRYKGFNTVKLPIVFEVSKGKAGLQEALNDLCKKAEQSVTDGVNYIILSDRFVDDTHAAIPSLLAVSTVHHHLIYLESRQLSSFSRLGALGHLYLDLFGMDQVFGGDSEASRCYLLGLAAK